MDINVDQIENRRYRFEMNDHIVEIIQTAERLGERVLALTFSFRLQIPARFSINVMIPDSVENACVTMNRQLLIQPFKKEWPSDAPALMLSDCQEHGSAVSTIQPGRYQKINFRWHENDELTFYIIGL